MLMRPISSRHTFEMHYRENMYFDDYEVRLRKGYIYIYIYVYIYIYNDQAVSEKTQKLCEME